MAQSARKFDHEYVRGSAAPARERHTGRVEPRRRRVVSRRRRTAYVMEMSGAKRNSFLRVAAYATVFLVAFMVVFSVAYVDSRRFEVNTLQRQLNELRRDNIILEGELKASYSLTEIERYAVEVLGMIRPDASQIVYVDDVRVSFTVQYDVADIELTPLDLVREMFRSVAGLFRTD